MLHSTIFRDIDDLSKHINNIYESIFKRYGLHRGQFAFITRIVENEQISFKKLAQNLRLDKTTVTRAIQKLETAGYITKIQDNNDYRLFHLSATKSGIDLYHNIIAEKNQIIDRILENFPVEQLEQLSLIVKDMNAQLAKIK